MRTRRHTDGGNTISVTWTERCVQGSKLGGAAGLPISSQADVHGYAKWKMDMYGYLDG